jgi:U1 small nuclear ribonucleoprotein
VRIVRDEADKSRGYGFVEFDSKNDFVAAYKSANMRKIDGHKIIVDYEKGIIFLLTSGRTLLHWRPIRLGGGIGGESRMTRK